MTRKLAIPLIVLSLVFVAGCGDDDDEGEGGGTPSAQTAPTDTTQAETTETTEPETGGAPPDKAALEACLAEADLELKGEDEEFTDAKGKTKTRQSMNLETAAYLGYVQWPSKSVADIYLGDDEAAAQKAEQEAGVFVKAFGFDPAKYVRRAGTVVMTFDDPPPSDEEAKAVEDCAAGA